MNIRPTFYLIKAVLTQGGISYWIDIDSENNMRLINIPFDSVKPVTDVNGNQVKYSTQKINLGIINKDLPEEEKYKYASDLLQFQIHFNDLDIDTNNPIPFFSGALEDCYTETLWRRLIRECVKRLGILKHLHYQIKEPESKPVGGGNIFNQDDEAVQTESQKAVKEIAGEIIDPTGKIVKNPESENNYSFVAGTSITDENVEIKTYSTLEAQAIPLLQSVVEKPIAAGLRVPAQFLGLSQSRTETQISVEMELFLEAEKELRAFISQVINSILQFRALVLNEKLPEGFEVSIKESDVVGSLKRQKDEQAKTELQGKKLANLKAKQDLGYEVTQNEIKEVGYQEAVKSGLNKSNDSQPDGESI